MISLHEGRGTKVKKSRGPAVYSLRLTVAGIQPRIWRRLLVRETMELSRLHEAIQVAFAWCDYQTHVFNLDERCYGNPVHRDGMTIEDDREVALTHLQLGTHSRLAYTYLFADGWQVDIRLEKTQAPGRGTSYPRCVEGQRSGPPEDCGGIEAYKDMLYCLKYPDTDLGREWREWLGPDYDPEKCDLKAINRMLRHLGQ